MMNRNRIAVFGANPAWQKTVYFEKLTPGEVNRAIKMTAFASGKGVNFCRAIRCAGVAETHLFQFADGDNGKKHQAFLDAEKLAHTSIPTGSETRICQTCINLSNGETTELIEPSFPAGDAACDQMVNAWQDALPRVTGCAITGSLPDKTDLSLYRRIAEAAFAQQKTLLVDAISGIGEALKKIPDFILKINAGELKKLMHQSDTLHALRDAAEQWRSAVIAITDGAADAYLAAKGKFYCYHLPPIKVINPIGSGDTASAVLLGELLNGVDAPAAFARALGAASANCLDPMPGRFDLAAAAELTPEIQPF